MLCKQGLVLLTCKLCQRAHVGALQAALCCSSAKCSSPEPPQTVERQQWGFVTLTIALSLSPSPLTTDSSLIRGTQG